MVRSKSSLLTNFVKRLTCSLSAFDDTNRDATLEVISPNELRRSALPVREHFAALLIPHVET